MENIGNRLKFFRNRSKLSQMDLELAIETSPGTVSRIENGRVNPTKETILKIADVLKLNNYELDYMIGITANPATLEEIERAKQEVHSFFNKKVFAYLIDERWRLWQVSKPFMNALGLSESFIKDRLGTTTLEFLTDPKVDALRIFSAEHYTSMLEHNLKYYYKEVGFMNDDFYFKKAVEGIKRNKIARDIWSEITDNPNSAYTFREGRIIYFKVASNITIPFTYSYEQLLTSSRFRVVEWTPTNKFIKLASKFLL